MALDFLNNRKATVWLDGYNVRVETQTLFGDKECFSGTPHQHLDPGPAHDADSRIILDCVVVDPQGDPIRNGDSAKSSSLLVFR